MRLLQVCNVGRIVGGTAACAWSICRALPEITHHVVFLSPITAETRAAFSMATVAQLPKVTDADVRALKVDAVVLHNTSPSRVDRLKSTWTLQYVHSQGTRTGADRTVYCSRWLASQCLSRPVDDHDVLLQCVPRAEGSERPEQRGETLRVGRLCTPSAAKWPESLVPFYRRLAERHPQVEWEFVGCPDSLQSQLATACRGHAAFFPAGWHARRRLNRWHALLYHHPALTETFGRTVAEAMRVGCLPIVDARGGFCEQVTQGSGWLCRSPDDFDAALSALEDGALRPAMSQEARRRAESEFSMAAFRRRFLGLLCAAKHPGR